MCTREREDIMRARNVLMDIIERNGIPVFQDIQVALKCAAVHLKQACILGVLMLLCVIPVFYM